MGDNNQPLQLFFGHSGYRIKPFGLFASMNFSFPAHPLDGIYPPIKAALRAVFGLRNKNRLSWALWWAVEGIGSRKPSRFKASNIRMVVLAGGLMQK